MIPPLVPESGIPPRSVAPGTEVALCAEGWLLRVPLLLGLAQPAEPGNGCVRADPCPSDARPSPPSHGSPASSTLPHRTPGRGSNPVHFAVCQECFPQCLPGSRCSVIHGRQGRAGTREKEGKSQPFLVQEIPASAAIPEVAPSISISQLAALTIQV